MCMAGWGIGSHIPNLGVKGWSVQLHVPSDLPSGEVPPVHIRYEDVRARRAGLYIVQKTENPVSG
jgi:hypothetical protein